MITFGNLPKLVDDKATARTMGGWHGTKPVKLLVGKMPDDTAFVVSLDSDGHCEASLSPPRGKSMTHTRVLGFFLAWGIPIPSTPAHALNNGGMLWIVKQGWAR